MKSKIQITNKDAYGLFSNTENCAFVVRTRGYYYGCEASCVLVLSPTALHTYTHCPVIHGVTRARMSVLR